MIRPVHARPILAPAHPAVSAAKDAFTRLYDANQADNINKRPGWPDSAGQSTKLHGGGHLEALGVAHLPKGSKAAHAIAKVIKEGVDGDQDAYKMKIGNHTYLVVASFPEDAARDQIWIFDSKGQHQLASATPNEETGKLKWK